MNSGSSDGPPLHSPRIAARRMRRSDSIPENSETTPAGGNTGTEDASIEELLMRHSTPVFNRGAAMASPLAERNSSPSPLRLNRPRSNPRSRTPMRISEEQHEHEEAQQEIVDNATTEGRRITIRLGTGSHVGTNTASYASRRIRQQEPARVKSKKQGPSHRKTRRWNNDNFVNLAAELSSGKGSAAAVDALLKGSAEASKHRSILDPKQHESKAMKQFREDGSMKLVREKFFEGSLPSDNIHLSSSSSKRKIVSDNNMLTPLERFHRIETRLRRIVVKACENSYAASKVVSTLEEFLVRVHNGETDERSNEEWQEFLLGTPTVTTLRENKNKTRSQDNSDEDQEVTPCSERRIIKFLFDSNSSTGGFHRLLLHGVCQFHCLRATSSSTVVDGKKARVLTATGTFSGAELSLVEFIMERCKSGQDSSLEKLNATERAHADESLANKLSALKV